MRKKLFGFACVLALGCILSAVDAYAAPAKLTVTSSAFKNGKTMPAKYGCKGAGVSPPLAWSKVPKTTKSIAILMVDPQGGPFYHWATVNLSPTTKSVRENFKNKTDKELVNDYGFTGYGEACPPGETHSYIFHVVAFDVVVTLDQGEYGYLAQDFYKDVFSGYLKSHIVAKGSLSGRYFASL